MKTLIMVLAALFISTAAMADIPDFTDWDIKEAVMLQNGTLGITAVNPDQTAEWKAVAMIAKPMPDGVVPIIIIFYDGINLKRYVLKEGKYVEFPLDGYPEAEKTIKKHFSQFVGRSENI